MSPAAFHPPPPPPFPKRQSGSCRWCQRCGSSSHRRTQQRSAGGPVSEAFRNVGEESLKKRFICLERWWSDMFLNEKSAVCFSAVTAPVDCPFSRLQRRVESVEGCLLAHVAEGTTEVALGLPPWTSDHSGGPTWPSGMSRGLTRGWTQGGYQPCHTVSQRLSGAGRPEMALLEPSGSHQLLWTEPFSVHLSHRPRGELGFLRLTLTLIKSATLTDTVIKAGGFTWHTASQTLRRPGWQSRKS